MEIEGKIFELHQHPQSKNLLYAHQCVLYDSWDKHGGFIVATKTGSGKTAAVTLPVIRSGESAVFIYPTNALIEDQESSILNYANKEGCTVRVLTPDNINEKFGDEDYHLIRIDAQRLENFRLALKVKDKSQALLRLIQPSRPKIFLINPDLLYLIFSMKYGRASAELAAHFTVYRTAVFDEFHLYSGVELAHSLFMIHLIREFGGFSRIVLLSATPSLEVLELLDRLLGSPLLIDSAAKTTRPVIGKRTAIHPLDFRCCHVGSDEVESLFIYLQDRKEKLETARKADPDAGYVPAVVILNSVVSALRLEDRLVEAGWDRTKIGAVRGLMSKQERQIADRVLVIGTSAIEVGIDFRCDLLMFEAGDAASFLQRLGRLGRHGIGKAVLFCNSREIAAYESLSIKVTREEFESFVQRIYRGRDAYAWFPGTFSGALTMIAQAESIRCKVDEDTRGMEATREDISYWLDNAIEKFFVSMGWQKIFRQVNVRIKKVKESKMPNKWINDYIDQASFRSSMPSVEVYDWAEKKRGRSPEYNADLISLLKWGIRSPKYKEKTEKIYIDGFRAGKPHNVYLSSIFENEETGVMYTSAEYPSIKIMQDGHLTSISHLFALKPYVFVLIPIEFARGLDWRILWFKCGLHGKKAAVFGGAALVVWEMYKTSVV